MSQPAASSDQISSSVACTSRVSVFVIDCTVIGAPPPTLTLPTWSCLLLRRLIIRPPSCRKNALTVRFYGNLQHRRGRKGPRRRTGDGYYESMVADPEGNRI